MITTMRRSIRSCHQQLMRWFQRYRSHAAYRTKKQYRKLAHLAKTTLVEADLRTPSGRRFLELQFLLENYLGQQFSSDQDGAHAAASQLQNVLQNCDNITYEEPGAAEAYAFLHFLDRYHRFQLTFERLNALKLMPLRGRRIDVLDIGTGPGPSMFALSDFYVRTLRKGTSRDTDWGQQGFNIDYVERSRSFRGWLHHFTEYVNDHCPTEVPWWVPFHHGKFYDFSGIQFDSAHLETTYNDHGDSRTREVKVKRRFDLIVMSNFLTTKGQVQSFSQELQDCARYLRHNGIMIIVGATNRSKKYQEVYDELKQLILDGRYSNRKLIAKMDAVDIGESIMKFSWNDTYGTRLKGMTERLFRQLLASSSSYIPAKAKSVLDATILPEYARDIEWQIFVFKKSSRPRVTRPGNRQSGRSNTPAQACS